MQRILIATTIVWAAATAACAEPVSGTIPLSTAEDTTGSIPAEVILAPAPSAPVSSKPASTVMPKPSPRTRTAGRSCNHLGCHGYVLLGVGF